jgi:hypothetical protein
VGYPSDFLNSLFFVFSPTDADQAPWGILNPDVDVSASTVGECHDGVLESSRANEALFEFLLGRF